jgi:hypothetical protein
MGGFYSGLAIEITLQKAGVAIPVRRVKFAACGAQAVHTDRIA